MDRRLLPLTALRSFESTARHLSFSRAADELGVTHGAVSRQIASLEATLSTRLFVRGATLALTREGATLFETISPAFDRIAGALASLAEQSEHQVVTVNAPPTFMMKWLIPRLSAFQRQHSHAEIRLATGTADFRAVKSGGFDIVIRRQSPAPAGADDASRAFLSGRLVGVCAPDVLEAMPVAGPADVRQHRLIGAATNATTWDTWFAQVGVERPPASRFQQFPEMFLALQAALDGLGIALVPLVLVADDVAAGRLAVALDLAATGRRDYAYIVSPLGHPHEVCEALCHWLDHEGAEADQLARDLLDAGPSGAE